MANTNSLSTLGQLFRVMVGVTEVKKSLQAGWNGWRRVTRVLCDGRLPARLKGKVYKTVVRPCMLCRLEAVGLTKRQNEELEAAEMKMLRFSKGVTRIDRIRN